MRRRAARGNVSAANSGRACCVLISASFLIVSPAISVLAVLGDCRAGKKRNCKNKSDDVFQAVYLILEFSIMLAIASGQLTALEVLSNLVEIQSI